MGNILSLQKCELIMSINQRRNYTHNGVEYVGPPEASAASKQSFNWDNLISNVGGAVTSIFGFLTTSKQNEYGQYYPQQQRNNTVLWIGIAVVILIVGVVIFATRKK